MITDNAEKYDGSEIRNSKRQGILMVDLFKYETSLYVF